MVGLDDEDNLGFFAGAGSVDPTLLPKDAASAPQGAIVEVAPARAALMAAIAERIAGTAAPAYSSTMVTSSRVSATTLQALRGHDHEDVLANPGEADLTTHDRFRRTRRDRARARPRRPSSTQGHFLLGMGILERAGRLGADASQEARQRIADDVERLAGPQAMGELFKVLAVLPLLRGRPPLCRGGLTFRRRPSQSPVR